MSAMTFRELAKKIHPDLNPGITDAGKKMAEAVRWKFNESMLFRLACNWGLVPGHRPEQSETKQETRRPDFTSDGPTVTVIKEGDVIRHTYVKRHRLYSLFLVVAKIERSKGKYKIGMVNNGRIYTVLRETLNDSSTFRVNNAANDADLAYAREVYDRHQERKDFARKARKEYKEEQAKATGIQSDTNYVGQNSWVRFRNRSGWFKVVRTTAKRVYFQMDNDIQEVKFANISSIWMFEEREF